MKKTVLCKYCGKEFSSYNPTPTFCSLKCKGLSQTIVIDFRKAMELYGLGMTKQEVANRLNTTRKVTENTFKRHNFKCRKAYKRNQYGVNNHTWSGDNPSYSAAHRRLIRKFGKPKKCEVCGSNNPNKRANKRNIAMPPALPLFSFNIFFNIFFEIIFVCHD
ncbi:hypothetical protein LCGC14_2828060 [marine sediment metagenome]|uniref:Uncharacterized protein n=1 Tax=marine sediment metagenome TaxID=412755 RepID=A0A0F8YEZ1_9ZZZZ